MYTFRLSDKNLFFFNFPRVCMCATIFWIWAHTIVQDEIIGEGKMSCGELLIFCYVWLFIFRAGFKHWTFCPNLNFSKAQWFSQFKDLAWAVFCWFFFQMHSSEVTSLGGVQLRDTCSVEKNPCPAAWLFALPSKSRMVSHNTFSKH